MCFLWLRHFLLASGRDIAVNKHFASGTLAGGGKPYSTHTPRTSAWRLRRRLPRVCRIVGGGHLGWHALQR